VSLTFILLIGWSIAKNKMKFLRFNYSVKVYSYFPFLALGREFVLWGRETFWKRRTHFYQPRNGFMPWPHRPEYDTSRALSWIPAGLLSCRWIGGILICIIYNFEAKKFTNFWTEQTSIERKLARIQNCGMYIAARQSHEADKEAARLAVSNQFWTAELQLWWYRTQLSYYDVW